MKKKFLSITMGTVLLLSTVLTGCGGNGGSGDSSEIGRASCRERVLIQV